MDVMKTLENLDPETERTKYCMAMLRERLSGKITQKELESEMKVLMINDMRDEKDGCLKDYKYTYINALADFAALIREVKDLKRKRRDVGEHMELLRDKEFKLSGVYSKFTGNNFWLGEIK